MVFTGTSGGWGGEARTCGRISRTVPSLVGGFEKIIAFTEFWSSFPGTIRRPEWSSQGLIIKEVGSTSRNSHLTPGGVLVARDLTAGVGVIPSQFLGHFLVISSSPPAPAEFVKQTRCPSQAPVVGKACAGGASVGQENAWYRGVSCLMEVYPLFVFGAEESAAEGAGKLVDVD